MKNPKEKFMKLIYDVNKSRGLDELTSKIISILYVEPKEVSLNELSKRTGYSLSAVSTSMKMFGNSKLIKRIKKPKSKKIYFYMEKDIFPQLINIMKKTLEHIEISKKKMPEIISDYKKMKINKEELKIADKYYKRISIAEKIVKKVLKSIEKFRE